MTTRALFKPLLIGAIVLNVISVAWLGHSDEEEPATAPRPPPPPACGLAP